MVHSGWELKHLAEVCSKPISYGIVQTGQQVSDGIPCVRVVDLSRKELKTSEMITTSSEIHQAYKKTILEIDELMMALRGEIGLIRIVSEELAGINITRGIARLAPKFNIIDPNYLMWAMRSNQVKNDLMRKAGGSALQEIALTALRKVKVPIPPLPEQRKIAKILSTWDKAISTTERMIDNSKQQKKALMQQLLTGKKRLLADSGKPFEGDWESAPLKKCVTFLNGIRKPLKKEDRADIQGKYPYYGATGVIDYVNDYLFDDELILLGEDGENILSRALPHVFTISGKSWVNNHAHVMKANEDKDTHFLCMYLESLDYKKYNSGSAQPKINKSVCEKIIVRFPALKEQKKITSVLTNADKEIDLLEQQLDDLKQEKKALMQQLLTGKRRVKLEDIEYTGVS